MKFVAFPSRGGKYLVVASSVTFLRTHENGQTKIGLIGGDSLQVDGSVEEVSAKILEG